MRALGLFVLTVALGTLAACAPRMAPAPIVETPQFPDFVPPAVPPEFAGTRAAQHQDRAWRFLQAGDLQNAQREVEASLQAGPEFRAAVTTDGYVRLAQGRAPEALARFEAVLAADERDAPALVGRGRALEMLEREPEAVAAFEAALAVNPGLTDVRRRIEVVRFRALERDLAAAREAVRLGRLDEAEQSYRDALASSPDSAFLYRELGDIERRRGNAEAALEHFGRASELDPLDAGALVQMGRLLEEQGDLPAALVAYDRALAIDPAPPTRARRDAVRERLELAALPAEYRAIETAAAVTRAELAALIGVRLGHVLQGMPAREGIVMTDVRSEWAEDWIVAVAQAGVMSPYANHTFQPGAVVRRVDLAQTVAQLLSHIAGPTDLQSWRSARHSFADLSSGHLAYPAVSTAVVSGVMSAAPGGGFDPSAPVSGADAEAAIDRLEAMALGRAGQGASRR